MARKTPATTEKKSRAAFYLPDRLIEKAKLLAFERDVPYSTVVEELLEAAPEPKLKR